MDKDTRSLGDRYKEIYAGVEMRHSDEYEIQLTDIVNWLRDKQFYLRDASPGHMDPVYGDEEPALFYKAYNADAGEFYGSSDRKDKLYQGKRGVIITVTLRHTSPIALQKQLAPQLSVDVKEYNESDLSTELVKQHRMSQLYYKTLYMWVDDNQWRAVDEVLEYAWEQFQKGVEEVRTGGLDDFKF